MSQVLFKLRKLPLDKSMLIICFCSDNNIKIEDAVTKQFKAFFNFLSKPCIYIYIYIFSGKQWQLSQFHKNSCMAFSYMLS